MNTFLNSLLSKNRSDRLARIALLLLLTIFFAYSIFIAVNLKSGLIPDEKAHFQFSMHFSTTWGIPPDVTETYRLGWYIQQNPFLYYWINGRVINFAEALFPNISNRNLLVTLRVVSALFAAGTAYFCYLLAKEVIKHPWWQLLPVYMLTHTLMFVYLAGGVNYDNLANLLSLAGIFFLVRVLNHKDFLRNSIAWLICIFTGTLVKYTILPLALAMGVVWFVFIIKNKQHVFPIKFAFKKNYVFILLFLFIVFGNLAIYGYNLVAYRAITPSCNQILTEDQCLRSPYIRRHTEIALEQKLTISEAINGGYPDPLTYILDSWLPNMLYRIFGIQGHLSYFPAGIIIVYRLLFYWLILLGIRYWKKPDFMHISLMAIFVFYSIILLITNYDSELVYGFRQIAVQGRYIFPVIGIAYVLLTKILFIVPNRTVKYGTLLFTLALFLYGGPIKFIRFYQTEFLNWFIR